MQTGQDNRKKAESRREKPIHAVSSILLHNSHFFEWQTDAVWLSFIIEVITSEAFTNTEYIYYMFIFVLCLECFNQGDLHFNVPLISIQWQWGAEPHAGLMDILLFTVTHNCVESTVSSTETRTNTTCRTKGRPSVCSRLCFFMLLKWMALCFGPTPL